MRAKLLLFVCLCISNTLFAQELNKMSWFNEPNSWEVKGEKLVMQVTPQSDYWRITHYGFTVDDGPFYYTTRGGEFEVSVYAFGDARI